MTQVTRAHGRNEPAFASSNHANSTPASLCRMRIYLAAGCVGHHEAGRLLHARSVQPDHVRVAHARESTHLPAHGLGDGAQRRLARLALVTAALLLDRDGKPLQEVGIGLRTDAAVGEMG